MGIQGWEHFVIFKCIVEAIRKSVSYAEAYKSAHLALDRERELSDCVKRDW